MVNAAVHLIPYALVAAVSAITFAATLAVIESGRLTALGFGTGLVLGQFVTVGAFLLIGGTWMPSSSHEYTKVVGVIELVAGAALLFWALRLHGRPPPLETKRSESRSKKLLERLHRVHIVTAAVVGFLLGIGGPKRLVLDALASGSIATSGIEGTKETVLAVWYTALATILVWAPVLTFVVFGKRAVDAIEATQRWVSEHRAAMRVYALVFLGVILIADGLFTLI